MDNNDTVTIPEEAFPRMTVSYAIYSCSGVITFVNNFLLFASVYRHQLLRERKEYIILSTMALMDLLQGYAFVTSGVGRIYYMWSGTANHLVTRTECLAKTWNWVWCSIADAYAATLLMVSVDRLLSVGVPLKYLNWGRKYASAMIVAFYIPCLPIVLYTIYQAQKDDDRAYLSQLCYFPMIFRETSLFDFLRFVDSYLSLASVVVYVGVGVLYRLRTKRVLATMSSSTQRERLESQRRLMVTLGISCAVTMLLYVSPSMFMGIVGFNSLVYSLIVPCMALNNMANGFVVIWRHKIIRKAIYCLLTNQKLTKNMVDALFVQSQSPSVNVKVAPTN